MKKGVPKVSDEHKIEVEEKIIQAARKNFAKKGYSDTSMDDIAKSAGVSKGGLYHHFPSKEELFWVMCKDNVQLVVESHSGLFEKRENFASDLGKFYDSMVDVGNDMERIWLEGMAEAVRNTKLRTLVVRQRQEIESLVAGFCKQMRADTGVFQNKGEAELRYLAKGMVALFNGGTIDRLTGRDPDLTKKAWIKTMSAIFAGS